MNQKEKKMGLSLNNREINAMKFESVNQQEKSIYIKL
jgi:hypothetical protein